jgi:hypothetical protein
MDLGSAPRSLGVGAILLSAVDEANCGARDTLRAARMGRRGDRMEAPTACQTGAPRSTVCERMNAPIALERFGRQHGP